MNSYEEKANDWSLERSEVSKISITVLMTRCEYILKRFLTDENDLGAYYLRVDKAYHCTLVCALLSSSAFSCR